MILEFIKIIYFAIIIFIMVILFSLIIDKINYKYMHNQINVYVDIFITWMILMIGLFIIKHIVKKIPFIIPIDDNYYLDENSYIFLFSIYIIIISTTQVNLVKNLQNVHKNILGY